MSETSRFIGSYSKMEHRSRYREYALDVVLCIDGTASMEDKTENQHKIVKVIKKNARKVYQDLQNYMVKTGRELTQLRVKLIIFRDYLADGEYAMLQTDFFQLPQQFAVFEEMVASVQAGGGGDEPEDGLEALAYAIRSNWSTLWGVRKRQVIIVWSDAATHELGHGKASAYYPKGMASNLEELEEWWDTYPMSKRLFLFAPYANYWECISDNWPCVYHIPYVNNYSMGEWEYFELMECVFSDL